MLADIRYALRMFAKNPGYFALAVVALGLGIGANSSIFSFITVYLLQPLPSVESADRVLVAKQLRRGAQVAMSYLDFVDWEHQASVLDSLAAVQWSNAILTGRGEPERIRGVMVSSGYFNVFAAKPAIGRGFLPAENKPGGERVILISDGFWQRHLGGKPEALGDSITLDGVSRKIVGIMPAKFRFDWNEPDFWAPLSIDIATAPRGRRDLDVYLRMKPGVTIAAAQTEMDTIARRLEMQYPETNSGVRASLDTLAHIIGEGPRESLRILMGVVIFVLLIACANVANLQLARATGRASEIAIRTAMGASRWRIIRQALTESSMAALLGGLLGYGLSYASMKILMSTIPAGYHPLNGDLVNLTALGFTAAIAILTGILSGLAPAFQISRVNLNDTLKEGGRGLGAGSRAGLRNAFVVTEVTLAVMLLIAAGLLVKGFIRAQQVNPGFRVDNLLTARISLPNTKYPRPEQRATFFRTLVECAAAIPGVESAAGATSLPMADGGDGTALVIDGKPVPTEGHEFTSFFRVITPGYFQTMGNALRRGRYFTEQDDENATRVVIVNERFARQFFPNEDAIGKRVKWSRDPQSPAPWMTIVGISVDVKRWPTDPDVRREMYVPLRQEPRSYMSLAIRTVSSDPTNVTAALRAEIRKLDADQPLTNVRTMRAWIEYAMAISENVTWLIAIFAGIALMMAAMGIYGVISFTVAQRTHELGIRMALGAGTTSVVGLVLRKALWLIGTGIAIGVPAAAAVTKFLGSFLYDVNARDPMTFVWTTVILAGVAVIASYLPAHRASKLDPMSALRCD